MHLWQYIQIGLLLLLVGCSRQPSIPESSAEQAYCLRSGEGQRYDCNAPALTLAEVRDPLAPGETISDEELMTLLAEVRRWLARRRLQLQGEPIPPELQLREQNRPPALPPTLAAPDQPLWPRVMESISRPSLQRNIP